MIKGLTKSTSAQGEAGGAGGLLDAALQIAAERLETLQVMRAAFERGDEVEAQKLAKKLCGFADSELSIQDQTIQ